MAFAWLLARGDQPIWFLMLALTLVGLAVSAWLGRVLPLADAPVTNAALEAAEDGLAAVEP